jgi:transcriptional regulator with XRE-family HTH domain
VINRLKLLIDKLSIKQNELSNILGVKTNTLNQYISGSRKMPYDILIKLAEFSNCDLNWLLTGKGHIFLSTEDNIAEISAGIPLEAVHDLEPDFIYDHASVAIRDHLDYDIHAGDTIFLSNLNLINEGDVAFGIVSASSCASLSVTEGTELVSKVLKYNNSLHFIQNMTLIPISCCTKTGKILASLRKF